MTVAAQQLAHVGQHFVLMIDAEYIRRAKDVTSAAMGIGNGLALRVEGLKDGLEASDAENLAERRRNCADAQRAGGVLSTRQVADEHAETRAVHERHLAEVQQNLWIHRDQRVEMRLKRGAFALDESAGTSHHGDLTDISGVERERHSADHRV